jgi:hypothetical protein
MECRCGAHFCYSCMQEPDACGRACADEEEEQYDSGGELVEPEDTESPSGTNDAPALSDEMPQVQETVDGTAVATSQPVPQLRNLDGGGQRYWEEQALDFGDEPREDYQVHSWNCDHSFEIYKIPLANALIYSSADEMECVKCWCSIHPEMEAPDAASKNETTVKIVPSGLVRRPVGGYGRGFGRRGGRRRGRVGYIPPRGLFQTGDAIGTAPHLTTTVTSPLSQSVPQRETSPMEDVQYSSDRVVDTYGNIISTSEVELRRRASADSFLAELVSPREATDGINWTDFKVPSIFSSITTTAKFSLAHECVNCGLLVCASCRDASLAAADGEE